MTAQADFESPLQRQTLSPPSRELIVTRSGSLDFTKEGLFDLDELSVELIPGLDEIGICVLNERTVDETTVTILNLSPSCPFTTPDGPFFEEIRGDTLPSTQIDVGTVSTFIRNQTASAVRIDALWFERAAATN